MRHRNQNQKKSKGIKHEKRTRSNSKQVCSNDRVDSRVDTIQLQGQKPARQNDSRDVQCNEETCRKQVKQGAKKPLIFLRR